MRQLENTHPEVYKRFQEDGLQVIRRTDEYWAGLSPDLVIEQALIHGEEVCLKHNMWCGFFLTQQYLKSIMQCMN